MRAQTAILLCGALLGTPVAPGWAVPTITVYADPPELEIWVDGARMGVGEAGTSTGVIFYFNEETGRGWFVERDALIGFGVFWAVVGLYGLIVISTADWGL